MHPKARIIAEAGPIVIGEGNLIEEQALIINGYFMLSRLLKKKSTACTLKWRPFVTATKL